ncbi:ABC transporter ATP-binding protein [Pleionea mediterranea]|uniref:ABC-2 type transport system ATP-binding protein n=1 Tax=Pleionea mediterranea TaxID=523701 RepID=A0A316FBS6_9GAMM|nr:ABC transporter ATP-binding protein [Pleionea mediterranea]PWK46328.1 ABC-2 type transport system ATP-binding protein [Pleionea mediterranea]
MNHIIDVNNLSKSFGSNTVLIDLSFKIEEGSVVGILGANGAGKTTLLQCLIGMLKSDVGDITILGDKCPNFSVNTKHNIGYVGQEADLLNWMKVNQIIDYTKQFYNHWNDDMVEQLLEDWDLSKQQKISKLSVGQRQKLAIILAVAPQPKILILDEPVASLDPTTRRKFIKTLIDMNLDNGQTILFSTHITSDLERVAAEVLLLKQGRCFFQGDIDDLKEQVVRLHISSKRPIDAQLPITGILTADINGQHASITVKNVKDINIDQLAEEIDADITIESLSLEDIFVELHS